MAKTTNIIEINGRRYDAQTGQLLGDTNNAATAAPAPRALQTGTSIDGFTTKRATIAHATHAVAPATTPKLPVAPVPSGKMRPITEMVRTPGLPVQHHKASSSKTLMRHAVAKPQHSLKRHTKVQHRTDVLVKQPSITVKPKLSSYSIDPRRVAHAKQIPRHPEARRYAIQQPLLATAGAAAKPMLSSTAAAPAATVATPAFRPVPTPKPQSNTVRTPDIFEQALARANSHTEKPVARRRVKHRRVLGSRALSYSAASLAVVLLVGFFAWQQKATFTMRYAAGKAGVAATLPGYKPSGFSAGKFTYSPGLVAVNFSNTETGDRFALIERSTGWDSQALLDSFVATKSRSYQTIDAAGRTIYTYGNNNATWVDNGIWYQINSKGSLSTNQLVQVALSM